MEQQYGSDFISITDEDGKEYELEILSTIEYHGAEYLALVPAEEDEASEELEVSILKSVTEDGEGQARRRWLYRYSSLERGKSYPAECLPCGTR